MLSFLTYCKGRLDAAKQTLPNLYNLIQDKANKVSAEIVLVEYDDTDLWNWWSKQNFDPQIFHYVWVKYADKWHMNHARNVAAVESHGDVLVFMDIDNILLPATVTELADLKPGEFAVAGRGEHLSGFLACHSEDYDKVNGYEESLSGYGYDDDAMRICLQNAGLQQRELVNKPTVLQHGERTKFLDTQDTVASWQVNKYTFELLRQLHPWKNNLNRNYGLGGELLEHF